MLLLLIVCGLSLIVSAQVEQKAFMQIESPTRRKSPMTSPNRKLVDNSLVGSSLANDFKSEGVLTHTGHLLNADACENWEVEKSERERRKSNIREKLNLIESGLASISADGSQTDLAGQTESSNSIRVEYDEVSTGNQVNEAKLHSMEPAATDNSVQVENVTSDEEIRSKGEMTCEDISRQDNREEKEAIIPRDPIVAAVDNTMNPRKIVKHIVPVLKKEINTSHLDVLDWEDEEDVDNDHFENGKSEDKDAPYVQKCTESQVSDGTEVVDTVITSDCPGINGDTIRDAAEVDNFVDLLAAKPLQSAVQAVNVTGTTGRKASGSSIDRHRSASTASTASDSSVAKGTMVSVRPSLSVDLGRNSVETDIAAKMESPPYVGNAAYEDFGVIENLELYFREQVFSSNRPSFPSPFIAVKKTNTSKGILDYVAAPPYTERFVSVYREKVFISQSSSDLSGEYTSLRELSGDGVPQAAETDPQTSGPVVVSTPYTLIVATDMFLYVLKDIPRLNKLTRAPYVFKDAPVPVLIKVHPFQCLRQV